MWERENIHFCARWKDELVQRKVQLGDSNFEYVEVISGLQPGDQVVVSDMKDFRNKRKVRLVH